MNIQNDVRQIIYEIAEIYVGWWFQAQSIFRNCRPTVTTQFIEWRSCILNVSSPCMNRKPQRAVSKVHKSLFFLCRCHSVSLASSLKHLRKIYKLVKLILCSDVPAMPIPWYHTSYLNHSRIVVQLHYLDTTFDMTAVSYIADHARFRFFSSC